MASLDDIIQQTARKQNGDIAVEKEDLLSESARIDAVAASKQAGKVRGEANIIQQQEILQNTNICNDYNPKHTLSTKWMMQRRNWIKLVWLSFKML